MKVPSENPFVKGIISVAGVGDVNAMRPRGRELLMTLLKNGLRRLSLWREVEQKP